MSREFLMGGRSNYNKLSKNQFLEKGFIKQELNKLESDNIPLDFLLKNDIDISQCDNSSDRQQCLRNLYNENKNKIDRYFGPNTQYINPNVSNFLDNEEDKINSYNQYQLDFLKSKIFSENYNKSKDSDNIFMNLKIEDIYNNIINLLPNLYDDYYKKHLEISTDMLSKNKYTQNSEIVKKTIMSMIFNNKNMIYLGMVIMIIVFFLYLINI